MKVKMIPTFDSGAGAEVGGISTVLRAYRKHLPQVGIELVEGGEDLVAIHAAATNGEMPLNKPVVSHLHGIYFTGEYPMDPDGWRVNHVITKMARGADAVTVPSKWVAETFQRGMRLTPYVVPHGIDVDEWQHKEPDRGYVLWNKNRNTDACNPRWCFHLANYFPDVPFVSTFPANGSQSNLKVIGVQSHSEMKSWVKGCGVYLSTTKETFGIGVLEAMASGKPVLGFREGNLPSLVQHGVNGYLSRPNDIKDLCRGLEYCLTHKGTLGVNSKELAKAWDWESVGFQLLEVYTLAIEKFSRPATTSIVIPNYNKTEKQMVRSITSALQQTEPPHKVIVVENNSTSGGDSLKITQELTQNNPNLIWVNCLTQGVAHARNFGISGIDTKYVCCLDADDEIDPKFLSVCVSALEADRNLGLAYTKLRWEDDGTGEGGVSDWPGPYDFDLFCTGKNQVPTCCVFRREMWESLGGYRQRYAPGGAGAEDAEFWLRAGAYGWRAKLVTEAPLFIYHVSENSLVGGNQNYTEVDWRVFHPWCQDKVYPFGALAWSPYGSHPVFSYDTPMISVVIPCSKRHQAYLQDALDSLEGQTLRSWEVIVVCDWGEPESRLKKAYPYVHWVVIDGKRGAGFARNRGAEVARSPLLFFLDADDWLDPNALGELRLNHQGTGEIAYSDYIGYSPMKVEDLEKVDGDVIEYNARTGQAAIYYKSAEFDCEAAQRQPDFSAGTPYIWNIVSSVVPRSWHKEIGGFDESMGSWEDWDYYIRLAKAGRGFSHVKQPLVHYRFHTGERRELGLAQWDDLKNYLERKHKNMSCAGCSGTRTPKPVYNEAAPRSINDGLVANQDGMVLVRLLGSGVNERLVVGRSAPRTSYGYRVPGEEFYVRQSDLDVEPSRFEAVQTTVVEEYLEDAPPDPQYLSSVSYQSQPSPMEDLVSVLPTMTPVVLAQLKNEGIITLSDLLKAGTGRILRYRGVGPKRAAKLMEEAQLWVTSHTNV